MTDTKILKDDISELDAQIASLKLKRCQIEHKLMAIQSPFSIGDKIQWDSGKQTRIGRVVEFSRWYDDRVILVVRRIKKNGTDGEKTSVYPVAKPRPA